MRLTCKKSLFFALAIFSSASLLANYTLMDNIPYPAQNEKFILDNKDGFVLHYDYMRDPNSQHGIRKHVWHNNDIGRQFNHVLTEEIKSPAYKKLSKPYPNNRWSYNKQDSDIEYTSDEDMESVFKLKAIGPEKLISINISTPNQANKQGSVPIQAVAVDTENKVLNWQGSGWNTISETDDHSAAADVAFVKVKRHQLTPAQGAERELKENGKWVAISTAGAMAAVPILAPFAAAAGAVTIASMAIKGATSKYYFYFLDPPASRFFKLNERWGFPKHATISPGGDIWMIGSDHAPYWGGHKERYKCLVDKDVRTFFIPPGERVFDISAGEGNLAIVTQDGIRFTEDAEGLGPDAWAKYPTPPNSLVKKMPRAADLPGGGDVMMINCGKSPDILWAVNTKGHIYRLSTTLDADDQKTWEIIEIPEGIEAIKVSNGASSTDGTGRIVFISKTNEVYLLVDSQNKIWRKLEQLKPSDNKFVQQQTFAVREANITGDGAMAILSGASKTGGHAFYFTPDRLAELGSPLSGLRNKDLVTVSVGDGQYFHTSPSGELTIKKFESAKEVESTPECIFSIYRHGDIFALRAKNGKWLESSGSGDVISTISATGTDSEMDNASPGTLKTGPLNPTDLQFVAVKVPELRKPENIRLAIKARNNNGFLNRVGKFISSVDPKTQEPFFMQEMDVWFKKVQDSSQLPIYMKVAESMPIDTVRIGFYMQLFKDYMDEDLYEDEFFTNFEDEVFSGDEDDERTLDEVLADEWQKSIPSIADEASAKSLIDSVEGLIDQKAQTNEQWTETNASNVKKILAALEEIFQGSPDVVSALKGLSKKISEINVFKTVNFKERVGQLMNEFDELKKKFSESKAEKFAAKVKKLHGSRIWGETVESGDGSKATGLDVLSTWLIRQAAKTQILLDGNSKSTFSKDLEDLAWSFIDPITVEERISTFSDIIDQPFLLEEEAKEMARQADKILEQAFLDRLTPNEVTQLKKTFKKAELLHNFDASQADAIVKPTLLECCKRLRARIDEHSDEDGFWDSSEDGSFKNSDGITVSYNAYTAKEFYDDIDRLIPELNEYKKAEQLEKIPPQLRLPVIVNLRQLMNSMTKGSLGQEADYSGLIDKIKDRLEQL